MILVLVGLVDFLYLAAYIMRRLRDSQTAGLNQTSDVVILERRGLSPKAAIYLVEVKGKQFLIGESPSGLTNLSETIK
jgi:flagellar biogenesis protein FliO